MIGDFEDGKVTFKYNNSPRAKEYTYSASNMDELATKLRVEREKTAQEINTEKTKATKARSFAQTQPGTGNYSTESQKYTVPYEPKARGQVTYNEVKTLKDNINAGHVDGNYVSNLMESKSKLNYRSQYMRYTQDSKTYDNIHRMHHALINSDYKTAQRLIDTIEADDKRRRK